MRRHQQSWTLSPYLVIFLCSVLVAFSPSLSGSDDNDPFGSCEERPFTCGNRTVEVAYPFNTANSPASCGHPSFELGCNISGGSAITIDMGRKTYVVLGDIDYSDHQITLLDQSFFDRSCPLPSEDTDDIDTTLFSYTDRDVEVTFFFECTSFTLPRILRIECASTSPWYIWPNSSLPSWANLCSSVRGRMDRAAVDGMTSNRTSYAQALQEGFTVTWTESIQGSCGECINSGGICRRNNSRQFCFSSNNGSATESCCNPRRRNINILMIISSSVGGSVLICFAIVALRRILKKRNLQSRKKKFYRRNLDLLRKEQSSTDEIVTERMKIYELDELEKATNYFDKTRLVGGGGHGKVYKGILSDQRVVAIKKPKITNECELGQFINEVFILSQTNHRNVVKFMGCCLQTEVPLLVFEFISGGTLSDHLLDHEQFLALSFEDRLRIAYEVARALSYIHSEASITIFHRDVKSSNILLDERNTAKLADFGASRVVACDTNSVTTIVQGTYGYLDPEYHQTGRLTDKSDVYSFGVILAELLTGRTAIPYKKNNEVRQLVMDFVDSLTDNSLLEIIDPLVLKEAKEEILEKFAKLTRSCLKLNGYERPTMKEVEEELEAMRAKKPKANPNGLGGTTSCFDLGVNSLGGTSSFFDIRFDIEANSLGGTVLIDSSME